MKYQNKTIFVNLIWQLLERFGAEIVTFIVSIVLARILDPTVYGTVALVTVFVTIFNIFVDSGFCSSLIQKENPDDLDFNTVFYFNIGISILLYVAIFFLAGPIANYFNNESLVWILRILSISIVINAFKNVQKAYISKHMEFKKYFFSTIGSTVAAGVVGIVLAICGYGVWALVFQYLVSAFVGTVILFVAASYKPKLQFSFARLKSLFSFGWKILLSSTYETIVNQLRSFIIGKKYTSSDLAYYTKGQSFPALLGNNISQSLLAILYPSISSVQKSNEDVKRMVSTSMRLITFLVFPMMMGLAVVADPLVRLLLTDKWIDIVPYIRVFCIYFTFECMGTATLSALKGIGYSGRLLIVQFIKKTIDLVLCISLMQFGIMWIALSLIISAFISFLIHMWINSHYFNYTVKEQLGDIFPNLLSVALMGLVVYAVTRLNINIYVILAIQIILGIILYYFICLVTKNPSLDLARKGFKTYKESKKQKAN